MWGLLCDCKFGFKPLTPGSKQNLPDARDPNGSYKLSRWGLREIIEAFFSKFLRSDAEVRPILFSRSFAECAVQSVESGMFGGCGTDPSMLEALGVRYRSVNFVRAGKGGGGGGRLARLNGLRKS